MASKFKTFKALHTAGKLFILPNAWNPESAAIFQENNYSAVGTSSAAVAASLGYTDGEEMPFADYFVIIRRIMASVNTPVTIDIEMGYGKTKEEVYSNLQKLLDVGVVGINIEDSLVVKGKRSLKDSKEFTCLLEFIKNKLSAEKQELFLNVRCDTYLLNVKDTAKETSQRVKLYESVGADGIFLPFIKDEKDIHRAVNETKLPLNVMCVPALPGIDKLEKLGVTRLSMGPFLHNKAYAKVSELGKKVLKQNSLKSIL